MKTNLFIAFLFLFLVSCRKHYDVLQPSTQWDLFASPAALPLSTAARTPLEGVYAFSDASATFGKDAAAHWSYTANGSDTTYYLSFFCEKDVAYFICQGRRLDSSILLNGYWRKMSSTETGRVQLTITPAHGGTRILNGAFHPGDSLVITGNFGMADNVPDQPIRLAYERPLYHARPFEIVVHRGGGQTADLLPASENSAEIVQLASQFGATGIEMDLRMTSDGVPILYHDVDLSERLIQKNGMVGPVESYTYAQLNTLVRLIRKGEHIPTLRQALETMVYKTPLRYIWLDTKLHGSLELIRSIQTEYMQRAAAIGRTVEITIGIPDQTVLANFMALPGYQNIPSVCELDPQYVQMANSRIWGPRWTLGLQTPQVDAIHSQGRRAFVWTLDIPQNIQQFMSQGHFDGFLSNYPSAVAYYYYVQQ